MAALSPLYGLVYMRCHHIICVRSKVTCSVQHIVQSLTFPWTLFTGSYWERLQTERTSILILFLSFMLVIDVTWMFIDWYIGCLQICNDFWVNAKYNELNFRKIIDHHVSVIGRFFFFNLLLLASVIVNLNFYK